MHKITSKPITLSSFETDDFVWINEIDKDHEEIAGHYPFPFYDGNDMIREYIEFLESLRQKYLKTNDVRYWKELIRWVPESWLQTRTVTLNYETLLSICSKSQRRNHKLSEWSFDDSTIEDDRESFIKMARNLPYARDFIFIDETEKTTNFFKTT